MHDFYILFTEYFGSAIKVPSDGETSKLTVHWFSIKSQENDIFCVDLYLTPFCGHKILVEAESELLMEKNCLFSITFLPVLFT